MFYHPTKAELVSSPPRHCIKGVQLSQPSPFSSNPSPSPSPAKTDMSSIQSWILQVWLLMHFTMFTSLPATLASKALYSWLVHSSVCYQTCECAILKTNEPILMRIGTSGPWGNGMKRSTLWVKRSHVKSYEAKIGHKNSFCWASQELYDEF